VLKEAEEFIPTIMQILRNNPKKAMAAGGAVAAGGVLGGAKLLTDVGGGGTTTVPPRNLNAPPTQDLRERNLGREFSEEDAKAVVDPTSSGPQSSDDTFMKMAERLLQQPQVTTDTGRANQGTSSAGTSSGRDTTFTDEQIDETVFNEDLGITNTDTKAKEVTRGNIREDTRKALEGQVQSDLEGYKATQEQLKEIGKSLIELSKQPQKRPEDVNLSPNPLAAVSNLIRDFSALIHGKSPQTRIEKEGLRNKIATIENTRGSAQAGRELAAKTAAANLGRLGGGITPTGALATLSGEQSRKAGTNTGTVSTTDNFRRVMGDTTGTTDRFSQAGRQEASVTGGTSGGSTTVNPPPTGPQILALLLEYILSNRSIEDFTNAIADRTSTETVK
jgi:hypothetical protein